MGGRVVKQVGQSLHPGTELGFKNRVVDFGRVLHIDQGALDIFNRLPHAFHMRFVKNVRQAVQGLLQGIAVAGFMDLVAVLYIQVGIPDLGDAIHVYAETRH